MSQDKKRRKKKHHKKKSDEQSGERPQSRLFTEADANSVETSGYTVGHGAPQTNKLVPDNVIPTGVVAIDESVKLSTSPLKTNRNQPDKKPNTIFRSKENIHLPPISQYHYPSYWNQPFQDQLVYSYPIYDEQHLPVNFHNDHHGHHHHHNHNHHHHQHHSHHHHEHQHHGHQKHHHHHRHRKHRAEVETYDPRWWYMPVNSVHRPKQLSSPSEYQYQYSPPKWYELPNRQNGVVIKMSELRPSHDKYSNCRCEVCSPSREPPRGSRWVAYT